MKYKQCESCGLNESMHCPKCGVQWSSNPKSYHDMFEMQVGEKIACDSCGQVQELVRKDEYLFDFEWKMV